MERYLFESVYISAVNEFNLMLSRDYCDPILINCAITLL